MYMLVPVVFRRMYTRSGDVSKTKREKHVCSRLYGFFVFNNLLVFSVFGSAWRFVASVIAAQDQGVWEAIRSAHLFSSVMKGLINVSTFWLTWQMQRNLGAAMDLAQAWPLVWNFIQRRLFSPTPRQLIELSAAQPFRYADYYNNYLFVATIGLVFGTLQPIILPITAFYLAIWRTILAVSCKPLVDGCSNSQCSCRVGCWRSRYRFNQRRGEWKYVVCHGSASRTARCLQMVLQDSIRY